MTAFLIKGKQPRRKKDAAAAPIEPASVYMVPKNGPNANPPATETIDTGNSTKGLTMEIPINTSGAKTPNDNTHSRISLGDRFRYLRFAHSKGPLPPQPQPK